MITLSEILAWDRKSYLTHVILLSLSRDNCHWLYWVLELMYKVVT